MISHAWAKRLAIASAVMALACAAAKLADSQIPAGTQVTIRTTTSLSSGIARAGETFDGTGARDVVAGGKTIKAGTPVKGKVTSAKSSGRLHAPGILTVRLTSIGDEAVTTSAVGRKGKSHTKGNATKIGGGAAA